MGMVARITRGAGLDLGILGLLLSPRWRTLRNVFVKGDRRGLYVGFTIFALLFWIGMLAGMWYLVGQLWAVEGLGPFLVRKVLDMLLASLFVMLCFSNVITALSTFYLSDDLELVLALPTSRPTFHAARFADTLGQSSWMLTLFGLPVFLAYGLVVGGGWAYYASLVVAVPAMLVISTNFGIILATVLVNAFPARRTRELMMIFAVVMIAALFVALRLLRPERLVDPDSFNSVAAYLAALQVPAPLFFPPRWVGAVLQATLFGRPFPGLEAALLISAALASSAVARWATAWGFDTGWAMAQEARTPRFYRSAFFDRVTRLLPASWRPIAAKELRVFTRDPSQWSQVFLLAGLSAVYLVSMSSLPVDAFHGKMALAVKNGIAVLNLGMGGFVMSAIGARFQYTAVGREGRAFWLLRGAPVTPASVLFAKGAVGLVPMVVVGQVVVVGSALMLGISGLAVAVESLITLLYALSLSGLAVAMGAWWPDFRAENAARAAQTPGAVFYMVLAQVLVFGSLVAYAVGGWGLYYAPPSARWVGWIPIGLAAAANLACAILPVRRAAEDLWARGL